MTFSCVTCCVAAVTANHFAPRNFPGELLSDPRILSFLVMAKKHYKKTVVTPLINYVELLTVDERQKKKILSIDFWCAAL
jgi:hypothetical protein